MKGPVAFLPVVAVAVLFSANFPTAMGSNRESASQAKRLAYLTQENKRLNDRIEEMQREIEAMGPAMLEEQKEIAARKFNEAEQLRLAKEAELKTQEAKLQEAKAKNETAATNLEQARLQAEAEMHRRTEAEIQLQLKRTETEKLEREARLLELEQARAHELAVESRERKEAVELELKLLEEERKKIRDEAAAIKEEGRKEGRLESKEKEEARASAMIQQLNAAKELALSQEQAAQAKADALRLELEKEEAALKKAQLDLSSMEQKAKEADRAAQAAEAEARVLQYRASAAEAEVSARQSHLETVELELKISESRVEEAKQLITKFQEEQKALSERLKVAIEESKKALLEREAAIAQERAELEKRETAELSVKEKEIAKLEKEALAQKEIERLESAAALKKLEIEFEERKAALQKEQLTAQEESEKRRLQTEREIAKERAQYEAEIATKRAQAEAEGRIKQERENEDLYMRREATKQEAEAQRWREALSTTLDFLSEGAKGMIGEHLWRVVLSVIAVSGGIFLAREGLSFLRREVERRVGQPKLIRETSMRGACTSLLFSACFCFSRTKRGMKAFDDVVLDEALEKRVSELVTSTRNAKRNHAPLRHVLFYGPPGTGKTMVAQRLARSCGLDYAIMSGGDVAPLGAKAVSEIHALFSWAKKSKQGLLLFIDEAEAFLGTREDSGTSEHRRNVLSALLYHSGTQSDKYMLVLASNRPGDLDSAITDRMDEALLFDLPNPRQRVIMLTQYFIQHILARSTRIQEEKQWQQAILHLLDEPRKKKAAPSGQEAKEELPALAKHHTLPRKRCCGGNPPPLIAISDDFSCEAIVATAKSTEGFSGRQLSKMMLNLQGAIYAHDECLLTQEVYETVMDREIERHKVRLKEISQRKGIWS